VPRIDEIRTALRAHRPSLKELGGRQLASVAVVLREDPAGLAEVLFIERALREGDPWSGHMAFPGGRQAPIDPSARSTAERETLEEVGLDLRAAETLGRLDDLEGRSRGRPVGLVVSAFVYHLPDPPPLRINCEVEAAFWVPLRDLFDRERHVEYRWRPQRETLGLPGIQVGEARAHVVWGLTYRFLERFLEVLGRPLPGRWDETTRA